MKEITEIDDARLVKGLAHPLRIHILRVLQNRVASPSEIAAEIDAPLGNVSYHVRFLAQVGLIELAGTKPRRGAVEHYYRAVTRVGVADSAWAQVPQVVRDTVVASMLEQVSHAVVGAARAGGFDRPETQASRHDMALDDRGWTELAAEIAAFMERANRIEREAAARVAAGDHGHAAAAASLVMLLFEHAAAEDPASD